jgi:hypothetical protein
MEIGIASMIFWLLVFIFLFPIGLQALLAFFQLHEMERKEKSPYRKRKVYLNGNGMD